MLKKVLTTTAAMALMAGAAHAEYTLHILHTNDLHSRIEPITKYDNTCAEEDNAAGECFGGYARLATKVAEMRAELDGENVLLLDAGDQYQGSLMYTTYKGDVEAEMMDKIGYDVMALGNHEFDDGPEGTLKLIEHANFPVISGNLDVSQSNLLNGKVKNYVVLEVGGEKIGIISALAVDTPETASPGPNVIFQDEADSLAADVAELEAEGVTKIIALTHVGVNKDLELAGEVAGIDAVVGGHSHTLFSNEIEGAMAYPTMVGEVPVVSAYAYSKYLGHLVLTFDDEGTLISATGEPILLDASVSEDADIKARISELAGPINELKAKVVAEAAADIDGSRETCRAVECAMGNLVADAMLDRVKDQGVEIAIQNGGGLRASIQGGQVTMGDVLTVLPFQNTLSTFQVTGATIVEALENGVSEMADGAGRFPQVAGMSYTVDPNAEVGSRISDVMVGGAPIEMDKVYGAVTNNYVRNGGDGYKMFLSAENAYDFGPDLADVLAEYMIEHAPYTPYTDGRITVK
ncbi:multifunctional 2',3'-cyclic-nucleotide 2'-phosphodiesterase/5'-nucleotidase/3'-nucleotidase [Celeribacter ethanolicus]|uniref:Multifunctional 2',3'-cyclic-nucleotide 2'-phosphodiesterase/5'-nucleotidase/3'-nucleotidase n=1 Tax=Celeribacter ethanolicus TaxID=1758178 RepID=A0A291GGU6_9RHOB|nr:bifunctional metallophosphatase/5'-nucleotidase [Celeribacter ethanolicus]ATG49401.1 multifunctional 2',3'-cyclic-nucleotide 2'-phosphodiesterase/5'-nucleotidase/3'-nucleotidase [Celeribacter ethanolicus]